MDSPLFSDLADFLEGLVVVYQIIIAGVVVITVCILTRRTDELDGDEGK